jgi:hypothetical protein
LYVDSLLILLVDKEEALRRQIQGEFDRSRHKPLWDYD